jgi:hypothetical protein
MLQALTVFRLHVLLAPQQCTRHVPPVPVRVSPLQVALVAQCRSHVASAHVTVPFVHAPVPVQ